jgi:hypothetical protein
MVYIRFTYTSYVLYLDILAVGKTNIHHLFHFLLFKFQIEFLVQLRWMSRKHTNIIICIVYEKKTLFASTN